MTRPGWFRARLARAASKALGCTVLMLASGSSVVVLAAEPVTPPAMYPPDSWEGRGGAVVRVLDKLDAHVQTLTIPAGQSGSYKSLGIVVRSCLQHPPGLPPDAAAFLTVQDGHVGGAPFAGWMYSAEPFITVYESPVYGVQLVSCDGADVAPAAPPLLPPPSNAPAAGPDWDVRCRRPSRSTPSWRPACDGRRDLATRSATGRSQG